MKKPRILVVGSMNMDLCMSMTRFPQSGETVLGGVFSTAAGGKGANQAVQAARLGAEVTMAGKVGDDSFGRELTASAEGAGIDTGRVLVSPDKATGTAAILLEVEEGKKSRNRIIVAPGANMDITPGDLEWLREGVAQFDMLMLQLEIPMEINELAAEYACAKGVPVMLNSAPSAPLSDRLLSCLAYISPNEHEAADLTGIKIRREEGGVNQDDLQAAVKALQARGVENVIITLGSAGAVVAGEGDFYYCPAVDVVEVKDPTAAGDSFVGAFCAGICAGLDRRQALDFASYTATLTVSKVGAQPYLPTLEEVLSLMKREKFDGFDLKLLEPLK